MASDESHPFIDLIKELSIFKKIVTNTQDTYSLFRNYNDQTVYEPSTFKAYPQSRTAQRFLEAYEKCNTARSIILKYKKNRVENDEDCEYLQPAFHSFSRAHMCENCMFNKNSPSEEVSSLLNQYLRLRPDDILAKYLTIILIVIRPFKRETDKLSDYKMLKYVIVEAEKFAYETERIHESKLKKEILTDHYFQLGAVYSATKQKLRALDSFQKSYDNDKSNYLALFGIAYHLKDRDPSKAVELFEKYIQMAPKCEKQYHDAYYTLAEIYFKHYKKQNEAFHYAALGDKHYATRLSFLPPAETYSKGFMDEIRKKLNVK